MRSYSDLAEEIIFDILSRLQAQSVGLYRCVSKPWWALLSRPEFTRTNLHRTRILQQESLILFDSQHLLFYGPLSNARHLFDEITLSATRLSFAEHFSLWIRVYSSCDGLLLVEDKGKEFILNPTTKEIREVPHSTYALDPYKRGFTLLCGLGYGVGSDDYKIATIFDNYTEYEDNDDGVEPYDSEMFVNVYSLKSGSWKRVESSPSDHSHADQFD